MAFQTNSFAKVWEIKPAYKCSKCGRIGYNPNKCVNEECDGTSMKPCNFVDVRITTSRMRQDTGKFESDFSGTVRMIGEAKDKAARLSSGDRIRLGQISTTVQKVNEKYYTSFQCFDFRMADDPITYVIVEEQNSEQASSSAPNPTQYKRPQLDPSIPAGVTEEELPFN